MKRSYLVAAAAALIAGTIVAFAQSTVFVTNIGDLRFPFIAPKLDGTAGTIDNMTIGATTPRAGNFTTITTTGGGALTADSITGTDASLGITGQATLQGGAIALTGGTSSTAGLAGGAVTATGGTPGSTGIGGAVTLTAGKGGSASGAGGVATLKGGAGTAGNAAGGATAVTAGAGQGTGIGGAVAVAGGASGAGATGTGGAASLTGGASAATDGPGGAASVVGGLGKGTGAGGAVAITGGTAGSTGLGGAIAITAGSPVAGNGSNVVVTASAGAGGTNAGGSVNLVPGAAVSTGVPGTIQVNGNASLMCSSYRMGDTPAAVDAVFFVATRPLLLVTVSQVHAVAAGGASTLQVTKDSTTAAPGAGTDLLTAAFNLNATANTVQVGAITTVVADKTFAAGDRLAVDYADAVQASVGVTVTACFAPL